MYSTLSEGRGSHVLIFPADLSLQAGWAAERRVRGNGWYYDVYYHAPAVSLNTFLDIVLLSHVHLCRRLLLMARQNYILHDGRCTLRTPHCLRCKAPCREMLQIYV